MQDPALALIWLLVTTPFALWAAVSDLRHMRIPNRCTDLMAASFVVLGAALLPSWSAYGWALLLGLSVLLLGIVLNAMGLLGAGDAKFMAAAAPFVGYDHPALLAVVYLAALLTGVLAHRAARAFGGPRLAPNWESWRSGKRFPMGLIFGLTLPAYFAARALGWPLP